MYLYSLSLQKATGITHAVHGHFSGGKQQEIVICHGKTIELLLPDLVEGKVKTLLTFELFDVVWSMTRFKVPISSKDWLVIALRSGKLLVFNYNSQKSRFEKIWQKTQGNPGSPGYVSGQYIASDPNGQAFMLVSVQEGGMIYSLNSDTIIPSVVGLTPIEVPRHHSLTYDLVAVDVGQESQMFAVLEIDYRDLGENPTYESAESVKQKLKFFEVTAKKQVAEKCCFHLKEHANHLIAVPGSNIGPSGVVVCSENYITYKTYSSQVTLRCQIPKRRFGLDDPSRGVMIVCSAVYRTQASFFILAQTDQGDIFKITFDVDKDTVTEMKMKYFDTIPIATSICILTCGLLFVASEFGNHYVYKVGNLGDDDEPEFSSAQTLEKDECFLFDLHPLKHLILTDKIESLCPIIRGCANKAANNETAQLYLACGRGPKSTIKILKQGIEVSELALSELPCTPNGVWTMKKKLSDQYDSYIVVSFDNATLVLSVGGTIEEVTNSGFLSTTQTLACAQIGHDSLVQIYPDGISQIQIDNQIKVWPTPQSLQISMCAVAQRQVVIALGFRELVYFEMNLTGWLRELTDRKEMPANVTCMSFAGIYSEDNLSKLLAIGLADNSVQIITLNSTECLNLMNVQTLPDCPMSIAFMELNMSGHVGSEYKSPSIYLCIGLQNGLFLRITMDERICHFSNTKSRILGTEPVKLFKMQLRGNDAVLAISSSSWLCYWHDSQFQLTPLLYDALEYASGITSEYCAEGIVAISSDLLGIFSFEKLGSMFSQEEMSLEYTPRRFVIHPESHHIFTIECDHNAYTKHAKHLKKQEIAKEFMLEASSDEQDLMQTVAVEFLNEDLPEEIFSAPKFGHGTWASVIQILDDKEKKSILTLSLEQNEAAHDCCLAKFEDKEYFIVGVTKNLNLNPMTCSEGYLHTYHVSNEGKHLELYHKTEVEHAPLAICPFQGKLLVGVGRILRMYALGKKKLLKKYESKRFANSIVSIEVFEDSIIIGDQQESIFFLQYNQQRNQFVVLATDINPRLLVAVTPLDSTTVAISDKIGQISVVRLPCSVRDIAESTTVNSSSLNDLKTTSIANFHVGEMVVSMQKISFFKEGVEGIMYMTLSGAIGVLIPFASHEDHNFFQRLEMKMSSTYSFFGEGPVQQHHQSFRSYCYAAKNIVDGDFCEEFISMDRESQIVVAADLEMKVDDVLKRLEEIRNSFLSLN